MLEDVSCNELLLGLQMAALIWSLVVLPVVAVFWGAEFCTRAFVLRH